MKYVALLLFASILSSIQAGEGRKLYLSEYRDRMAGAWLGQSVGVAYGAPTEFKAKGRLMAAEEIPAWKPACVNNTFEQDDLYVELSFMRTLETRGIDVSAREAGLDFANSRYRLWCANYNGRCNIRRGIPAPASSHPDNHPTTDDIDYQIEADFSGILAPGLPARVLKYGETFGRIMNYGDGLYAGEFIGGLYAAAYFEKDRVRTVQKALKLIPAESRYAEMVRDMLAWYAADPKDWQGAWRKAVAKYQSKALLGRCSFAPIDVKINGAMVLLGYLYGEGDIARTLEIATRGGFDSDCNPSSALGVLGVQIGAKGFDARWVGALDPTKKWEFTEYTYPDLLAVSEKLTRQIVLAEGGQIAADAGGEYFLLPEQEPAPEPFASSAKPLPCEEVPPFSAAERDQIRFLPEKGQGAPSPLKEVVKLTFDKHSLMIGGKRVYLVSGEFHYFRVPKADWKRRLELLKAAGGNCVATYVPWCVHEEVEGQVRFGDRPERDLDGFLTAVKEAGLMAIVRPGPYQYSELVYNGLPRWLIENHPEILTKRDDGSVLNPGSVDYNHPLFLEKACRYLKKVAGVLRPHMAENGGPVQLVQLDNELTGIHVWFGGKRSPAYYADAAKYLATIRDTLAARGIGGPYCHNAGGAAMSADYSDCVKLLGTKDFILGYDHYYGLFQNDQESPAPYYFFNALFACDVLKGFGYPPLGFEIQCGTIGDVPPIFREDLLACYMCNLAAGMKGVNYYVFTGGPNFKNTGSCADIYDYNAPIAADGTVRPTYGALKDFGAFVTSHPELLEAERKTSVRLGGEWRHFANIAPFDYGFNRYGMFYSLMQSALSPEYYLVDGEIPLDGKPLVLAGVTSMSAEAQQKVVAFVRKGGALLVAPDFPRVDLEGKPCTVLADALGAPQATEAAVNQAARPCAVVRGLRVYGLTRKFELGAQDQDGLVASWTADAGRVTWLGATWKASFFAQADLLAKLLGELGAKEVVRSTNRHVLTTAFALPNGRTGVFALNLRAAPQETTVSLPSGGSRTFALPPMKVEYGEIAD